MARRIDSLLSKAQLDPLERSAWVEVELDQLVANARSLTDLAAPAALAAVVKADGYGHGLEIAARCAVSGGASWLGVADAGEAGRLRADGYRGRLFVLYPVPPSMLTRMADLDVDVTVGSTQEAVALDEVLGISGPELSAHLEIDTGMTRGGVPVDDAIEAASTLVAARSARLAGVWTHLASPEDSEITAAQLSRFELVLTRLRQAGIDPGSTHAAASGGLLSADTSTHAFVRPGLALYGHHPEAGDPLPEAVRPALAVKAHAVRIAPVSRGTSVGYAGTWSAERDSIIATLPLGYADGWSRASSPGTHVLVEGRRAPLVGRVSSDSITVDVTDVAGVGSDSEFTLLGRGGNDVVSAEEVAGVRRTISWEVLQQLGSRLARIYMSNGVVQAVRRESRIDVEHAPDSTVPGY